MQVGFVFCICDPNPILLESFVTKNIFMSYSRRELGFVDQLTGKLEEQGYGVWLDYRVLIPGSPWDAQIEKGIRESDTILLVVSKASLASEYVELEWREFLKMKKRFILLIFEAVDLPKELEPFEWVDFRGSYRKGLKELFAQLKGPVQEERPAPQTGFKAPANVFVAVFFSVLVALLSLGPFWTFFIPWFLFPLPYQIFKRNFNFTQVQAALIALPFAISISARMYGYDGQQSINNGFFLALILLLILRSPAMQRWGKPEANISKFIKPAKLDLKDPKPVSFYVDHAAQDAVVAEDLAAALKKYGHPQAKTIQDAKAVFVLISRFKGDTDADPSERMVFPIMVQLNQKIAPKLLRIQWIDFRPGVRGLDVIAQLLPEPAKLLKALGIRPVSAQTVYPPVITALYYYLILLGVVVVGSIGDYLLSPGVANLSASFRSSTFQVMGLNLLLFCGLIIMMVRGLTMRTGWFSSFRSMVVGVMGLGGLIVWQMIVITGNMTEEQMSVPQGNMGGATVGVYFFGILAMALVLLWNRQDLRRWFPAKSTRIA
jgi:hypothetical protein